MLRTGALILATCAALAAPAAAQAQDSRIVGGNTTTIGEWPWQVAIADPPSSGGNGFQRQFCGGSLVAPTIVVTAAHCVYTFINPFGCTPLDGFDNPASDFSVITGRTMLSSSEGQEIPVSEIYYFEDNGAGGGVATPQSSGDGDGLYDCASSRWDVVFLQLGSASSSTPIKIAGPSETAAWAAGKPAFVTGWGATSEGGSGSDTLLEAEVEMISDSFCGSAPAYGSGFEPATMVCAGVIAGGKDTCQGDSGGPLVVPIGGGTFRLVGDTSWGDGCAQPNKPGVYGRIAADPMRTALQQGIGAVAPGAEVVGVADTRSPRTEITAAPPSKTRKRGVRISFLADETVAGFECSLDNAAFAACTSPFTDRVKRGRHSFGVRATDLAGNVGLATEITWKVRKKKKRRG